MVTVKMVVGGGMRSTVKLQGAAERTKQFEGCSIQAVVGVGG